MAMGMPDGKRRQHSGHSGSPAREPVLSAQHTDRTCSVDIGRSEPEHGLQTLQAAVPFLVASASAGQADG